MKTTQVIRTAGFTLIELLVVITIIAVLAGLAIPTANIVLRKAKERQAQAAIAGLVNAVKAYQMEYNRLPNPNAGGGTPMEIPIDTDASSGIIDILLAKNPTLNPREIMFYDPPIAKSGANGLVSPGGGAGGGGGATGGYELVDPWRQPYHMVLDYDGDHSITNPVVNGTISFSQPFLDTQPENIIADVVVYSDNDPLTRPASTRKPITSW